MQQQPPSDGGSGTASELRSDAKQLGNSAANRIHSEVDARKDTAVGQAKSVSSAIQRATGEMGQDTPDWLKSALRQGAQKIQTFADTIEQKDSRELMRDTQDFARSNPGTFLAACAAAGFAAARILKAGAPDQYSSPASLGQQPGVSNQPAFPNSAQLQPGAIKTGEFA
jgi:ElaB/YqjD/DUF883 family membrane-anchored ribosome-binding protein